jgi:hypothetical protein
MRFDLVNEDGALLTPVSGRVTLTVSVQIQPANPTPHATRSGSAEVYGHAPTHGSADNSLFGSGSGTRNQPIAPGDSGPCRKASSLFMS